MEVLRRISDAPAAKPVRPGAKPVRAAAKPAHTAAKPVHAAAKPGRAAAKPKHVQKSGLFRGIILFTAALLYFEVLFRYATIRTGSVPALLLTVCFSASAAVIPALLSSFFGAKANRIIRTVLLFLLMIPYGLEFFIFREYNILYDVNTILNGAGGAAKDFKQEIFRLVFSLSGISHLLLLAAPALLYLIFGRRIDPAGRLNRKQLLAGMLSAAACFAVGFGSVRLSEQFWSTYHKEYSFPAAVRDFGLLTGLRLDIARSTGEDEPEFELTEPGTQNDIPDAPPAAPAPATTGPSAVTEVTTTTTTYSKNELDLDFAAMAESEGNKTWAKLDKYVASLTPSSKNQYTGMFAGKNLIMISAEAFTREVIRKDLTPTLYRLYTKGICMTDYYQQASAGTTGGEFQNIFGLLPMKGGASFPSFSQNGNVALTMAYQLNLRNYWGKAYHNNSYTFYSRNKTHNRLGYSEGFMGYGNGMEKYVKKEWPQSDKDMIEGTLTEYIDQEHFNVYYMSVSGHNGYDRTNAMTRRNWDKVKDLDCSDKVKSYLAANLELENALTVLVNALEEKGIADDTVICISADHFPYGLDDNAAYGQMKYLSELYGYDVRNEIQRDHNAAILWCGCLEDSDPIVVDAPTSSIDLLPTLSNLFGLEYDSRLMPGRDVLSDAEAIYFDRDYNWKTELGTYLASSRTFTPKDANTVIPENYVERIKTIVRNKVSYCQSAISSNYIAHVLPAK